MTKQKLLLLTATALFLPGIALAECAAVLEPTLVAETTRYERAVTTLNRQFLKEGKSFCRNYNREHRNEPKTKPLVTRSDTAIDLVETPAGLIYRGELDGRVCCYRANSPQ